MEYTPLGRTGMRVSRMGLGGGGHSQLGRRTGRTEDESVTVVKRALDRGINFIDTAEAYGTEEIVGRGIAGHDRSGLCVSTKKSMGRDGPITAADLRQGLEQSLRRLRSDYVDVYHLHGVDVRQYAHAVDVLVPEMLKLKDQGKIRALGITEAFNADRGHDTLREAVKDDCWDVIMVGFNILNQSARERVLGPARQKNVGVLDMFAVRSALSDPEKLRQTISPLVREGKLAAKHVNVQDPLGWLVAEGHATSIPDAAYRFCRDEPGVHVVLVGTGNVDHLEQNVASLERPPLPQQVRQRLAEMFRGIDSLSGQ